VFKLWIFLGGLAQLASCARRMMTSVPIEHLYDARPLTAAVAEVRDAAAGGSDDFVVVSGGGDVWENRKFTRIRAGENEPLLSIPDENNRCVGERLVLRSDGSWWYSRCGGDPDLLVRFVTSSAPSHPSSLHIARQYAVAWLPLDGDEPSGVLLSHVDQDDQRLLAELVTPVGTRELGIFYRRGRLGFAAQTWQAHRLHDDRIAVVSIEDDDFARSSAIILRLIRDGEVTESRLPFDPRNSYSAIATAVGDNGDLAIVAAISAGLVGMTVDPDKPQLGRARMFSDSSDATLPFPGIRVISTGDRFMAAWVRRSHRAVRLCEFDRRFVFPAISAGDDVDRYSTLLAVRKAPGGVDFFWVSANKGVMWRRLPERPTGYLLAAELCKLFRKYLDRIVSTSATGGVAAAFRKLPLCADRIPART
jgi:hypothetical protein